MSFTFGVVADIHGNFTALDRVLRRHPEVPFWLCVGDVASNSGAYPEPAAPLYWIKGNNESFDRIDAFVAGTDAVPNLHYIPNGAVTTVGPITVGGVGGTFAPTWYDTPAADLPRKGTPSRKVRAPGTPPPRDDKRRHFVREEVEACTAAGRVDVLLTHEAPKPFWNELPSSTAPAPGDPAAAAAVGWRKRWRRDVGKVPIAELADAVQPRLHCFGHHHVHASFTRAGIPTVCVDRVSRGYLLVNSETFAWDALATGDA